MSLTQLLIKKGLLDKERAKAVEFEAKKSGQKEEEVILGKNIVPEDYLFGLKSEDIKVPLKEVSFQDISLETLETIPEESARYYKMVPLKKDGNLLEVGMAYPEDLKAREALEFLTRRARLVYRVFLITPTDLEDVLKKYRTLKKEVNRALEELETEVKGESPARKMMGEKEIERLVEDAPISKMVAVIIRHAVDGAASDIHIEGTKAQVRVRFRQDGILHSSLFLPSKVLPAIISRIKILASLKIDETRIPQDGRFSAKIEGNEIDFRVSTFPTVLGEKVAIRILDPTQRKINFQELGITGRNLKVIQRAIERPYGMILSTGPTGSGKTTTLYAIMNLLNKEGVNIVTLEDPIEYFMEGVNQSQVKPEIGYTFANGLRSIVRQDPDVIMVGEIRDDETASLALHAALTGHIVLSTLHTSNALGVIPRLVDMGAKPFLLPPTLTAAIAQRLVRKLCPFCKHKTKPSKEIKKLLDKEIESFPAVIKREINSDKEMFIYEPVGCPKCGNSGYSGRVGVFEILEMTERLADIILKDLSERKIKQEAEFQGMVSMKQDGILKVLQGLISFEEAMTVAEN